MKGDPVVLQRNLAERGLDGIGRGILLDTERSVVVGMRRCHESHQQEQPLVHAQVERAACRSSLPAVGPVQSTRRGRRRKEKLRQRQNGRDDGLPPLVPLAPSRGDRVMKKS